jgi:pyruvate dehydrogenase E1 component beta subunit
VPDEEESQPIGKAEVVREGKDLTVISYGAMLRRSLEAASQLEQEDGVSAEVIDLLTLSPMDDACFCDSLEKTGRVVVVHEAHRSFGAGAEIIARLMENSLLYLEAPVGRATGFDCTVPLYAREQAYLPGVDRIVRICRETLSF